VEHCVAYSGAATICGTLRGVQWRSYDLWNNAWRSGAATICGTLSG